MFKKQLTYLIAITFFIKLVIALNLPLVGDEAYYWVWGQHLQLSYFDHPPMVAFFATLSNYLTFLPQWVATRLIFTLLSCLTFFVWMSVFIMHRRQANSQNIPQELNIFAAFFMLNPFLGLGSILITPDAPLLLFWGLASYYVLKIIAEQKKIDYILLGAALGLGFCSKYHIVFFPLVTIVALAFEKKLSLLLSKKIVLTLIFGLLFCTPVLLWNYQNDFSSFKFQLNHGLKAPQPYEFWWTSSYVLGQIFIFNPVLFFAFIFKSKKSLFKMSALGQWAFFLYSSFKAKVEANWPMTSHASALIDFDSSHKKIIRYALGYSITLWLIVWSLSYTSFGMKKLRQLPTSITVSDIYPELKQFKPLYGPSYQLSSLLTILGDEPVYKLYGLSRYDFFDSLPESKPTANQFYVLKYANTDWPYFYEQYTKTKVTEFSKYNLEVFEFRHE